MTNKFLTRLADGSKKFINAIATSSGVADQNKIPATGADGKLHISFMPSGLDVSAEEMEVSEAVTPGDFINIYDDNGTRKVRLADANNNRPAHGFTLANIANNATGIIYTNGINTELTGLTPGKKYFLDKTPGNIREAIDFAPGSFIQTLGTAISSTALRFEFDEPEYN